MKRRDALKLLGAGSAAAVFTWTAEEVSVAAAQAQQARANAARGQAYRPKFFSAHEYATVVALADMIIPKDDRSGSASDAGAPEFIDYIVSLQAERQTAMRGGLSWLDDEMRRRVDKSFVDAAPADRTQMLDDIAYPRRVKPGMSYGVRFFTTMRDLVATGFWSSKMGIQDIGYLGNVMVAEWTGPPPEVLRKLGLTNG
jgi:hypothetical protein